MGRFAAERGASVVGRFVEVVIGRESDRPKLAEPPHLAKVTGATLVFATRDRLSRNAAVAQGRQGGGVALRRSVAENADTIARELSPMVAATRAEGATSLREAAGALNARGIRTRRGGRRRASSAMKLPARWDRGVRNGSRDPPRSREHVEP